MCGIALVVERNGAGVDPDRLAGMTAALAARGPDDEAFVLGEWATGAADCLGGAATDAAVPLPSLAEAQRPSRWSIGLGVRRLAIRDPHPRARQPMRGDRGLWLAFNGELYNADAIRDALRGDGPRVPHRGRHRGVPRGVGGVGAGRAHAAERDVGLRGLGRAAPPAVVRARSARHQAALPGPHVVRRARGLDAAARSSPDSARARRPTPPAIAEYLATGLLDHAAPTCFSGIARIGAGCLVEIDDAGVVERRWAAGA